MHWLELKVPPPVVALCLAGAMWLAARALPLLHYELPGRNVIAIALIAAGIAADIASIVAFARARTTVNPLKPASTSTLVTTGINRYTRNPMYLGMLMSLLAWAIYLANASALALLPAFVLYLNRFQIEPEEKALTTLFGEAFNAYKVRVRRWL
ncbi:MAG: conserved rane protein of unknown function [Betaproteobacteria bacterium]|jgi:protein-S-isoprenylcysteine O-methyltransferase Ste14|nr:conserved rane protein of unknown function [Betaproteobacteria bacterium]